MLIPSTVTGSVPLLPNSKPRPLPSQSITQSSGTPLSDRIVTYDLARLMDDATEVKTSEFADAMIARM